MKWFTVEGARCALFTLCLEAPEEYSPKDLSDKLKSILGDEEWITVISSCDLVPPEDVLLSPCMYAVKAYRTHSMISKWLEIEILLYLLGDRNIRKVISLLAGKTSRKLGLVCLTLRPPEELESKLRMFSQQQGMKLHACGGEEWVSRFAELLNLKCENPAKLRELVIRTIRAKAAMLSLEAQK